MCIGLDCFRTDGAVLSRFFPFSIAAGGAVVVAVAAVVVASVAKLIVYTVRCTHVHVLMSCFSFQIQRSPSDFEVAVVAAAAAATNIKAITKMNKFSLNVTVSTENVIIQTKNE